MTFQVDCDIYNHIRATGMISPARRTAAAFDHIFLSSP